MKELMRVRALNGLTFASVDVIESRWIYAPTSFCGVFSLMLPGLSFPKHRCPAPADLRLFGRSEAHFRCSSSLLGERLGRDM